MNAPKTTGPMSMPNVILRLEGLAQFAAAVAAYIAMQGSALLFVILLFAPDLSMLGYLAKPRIGSVIYNIVHTWIVPATLLALGMLVFHNDLLSQIALIWLAHIGMDRVFGFGIKYPTVFEDTHFQHI